MTKKEFIETRFDIDSLREIGFLKTEKTTEEIAKRICTFFGFKTIFEYDFMIKDRIKTVKADIKTFSDN